MFPVPSITCNIRWLPDTDLSRKDLVRIGSLLSSGHIVASAACVSVIRRVAPLYKLPLPSAVLEGAARHRVRCSVPMQHGIQIQELYAVLVHQLGVHPEVLHIRIIAQAFIRYRDRIERELDAAAWSMVKRLASLALDDRIGLSTYIPEVLAV